MEMPVLRVKWLIWCILLLFKNRSRPGMLFTRHTHSLVGCTFHCAISAFLLRSKLMPNDLLFEIAALLHCVRNDAVGIVPIHTINTIHAYNTAEFLLFSSFIWNYFRCVHLFFLWLSGKMCLSTEFYRLINTEKNVHIIVGLPHKIIKKKTLL